MTGHGVVIETPALVLIGAQKAATTWLAHLLQQHEAFHFSFLKEVHFFSRRNGDGGDEWLQQRVIRKAAERRREGLLEHGRRRYLRRISRPDVIGTDAWYRDLFYLKPDIRQRLRKRQPLVLCDFTPHYMTMSEEQFDHIPRLLPAAQLLLVIRDPMKRMISGFSMSMSRHPELGEMSSERQWQFLIQNQERRGDYRRAVSQLRRLGLPHHIVPFTDMLANPASLVRTLERAFGLEPSALPEPSRQKKNSHSGKFELPPRLLERMEGLCAPQYEFLEQEFGTDFLARI